MNDVTLAGLLIPGVAISMAGSVAAAAWGWATQRQLVRLTAAATERQQLVGLVHPRRVEAALEVWRELATYDRWLQDLVAPFDDLTLDEEADGEERREAWLAHEERVATALAEATPRLMRARSDAECFLSAEAVTAVTAVVEAYANAHNRYWASRAEPDLEERRGLREEARLAAQEAGERRSGLLEVVRRELRSGGLP